MAKSSKPPEKSAEPHLIPQPSGRGALWSGGRLGNRGGLPGRSGRKSAAWKARCAEILEDSNALQVLAKMISGEILEKLGETRDGEPIIGETKNKDRLGAIEFLARYGHGLPVQKIEGDVKHLLIIGSASEMAAAMALPESADDVGDADELAAPVSRLPAQYEQQQGKE